MREDNLSITVVDERGNHKVRQNLKYYVQPEAESLTLEIGECVYHMNLNGEILSKSVPKKHLNTFQKLQRTYTRLNNQILHHTPYNDKTTRDAIKREIERLVPGTVVTCDETNNTSAVIAACELYAHVSWAEPDINYPVYVNLIFGNGRKFRN